MKEKVYLDSTIPIYYFDQRESLAIFIEITRKWWSEMSMMYDVFISDAVLQEFLRMPVITAFGIFLHGIATILPTRINGSIFGSLMVVSVCQRRKSLHR